MAHEFYKRIPDEGSIELAFRIEDKKRQAMLQVSEHLINVGKTIQEKLKVRDPDLSHEIAFARKAIELLEKFLTVEENTLRITATFKK